MSDRGCDTVVWSGGADSTLALTLKAQNTSSLWPVYAVTVERHPQIDKRLLARQRAAQRAYLAWAKRRGYHIKHVVVSVAVTGAHPGVPNDSGQSMIWLCALAPYFQPKSDVTFGYIRPDDVWHGRREFEESFNALARLGRTEWKLCLPLEWHTKGHVLEALRKAGVPESCWWSCESPKRKACGRCNKCRELRSGRAEIRDGVTKKLLT